MMGVYVFRCRAGAWIKVGHFKVRWGGRRKRLLMDNPWFRVERRGFASVLHPSDLNGRLSADDLDLVAWYPDLDGRCEGRVHKAFSTNRVGEFHPVSELPEILQFCDTLGDRKPVLDDERLAAKNWSKGSSELTAG